MNSWDPIWEKVFQNQEWGKYPGENLIQFIARNYYNKDRGNINLLEVGCGPGANIWFMAREGFNVSGIDGSETAIEKAKERLLKENLKAELIVGDIIKLPFKNQEFHGIIDNECLHCNSETNTLVILSEINRVLKKDGLFYSRTFSSKMFIGKDINENGFEFSNISEGPLSGKGFIRLIDEQKIKTLYGRFFKMLSIDKLEYTQYNGGQEISEYIIVCQKK
jgi:ubiquinone/menaquinone biosynthesis C-methylase UbiE